MDTGQEQDVARGLQEGNTDAWLTLYDAYSKQIWQSVARLMGPHPADVADVVQETFLAAACSARGYDPARGSLWMWLSGIARKHVALHYRKQERHDRFRRTGDRLPAGNRRIAEWFSSRRTSEPEPSEPLATAEVASMVRATLSKLPADYETLLAAKYFDAATVEEIAALENCSLSAVRSKLARARRAFRRAFVKSATPSHDGREETP